MATSTRSLHYLLWGGEMCCHDFHMPKATLLSYSAIFFFHLGVNDDLLSPPRPKGRQDPIQPVDFFLTVADEASLSTETPLFSSDAPTGLSPLQLC